MRRGYKGKIVSFEPLSRAHRALNLAAKNHSNWLIHPQVAIAAEDCEIQINISKNSVSSSILPMLDAHSTAAPDSLYIASEKVAARKLDSIAAEYLLPSQNLFIKIDTQGYEWFVIDGASDTLKMAKGLLCELSLLPLYEGQHLWLETIERLESYGFALWALQKGFTDPHNGRTLQVDAIFLRQP
jgi:FkbM family methyltransferase